MAYLAPIHRPSSVRHAIKINFLGRESEDLIVAKASRLEIWSPIKEQPDQLSLRYTKGLYGKVTLLHKLKPAMSQTEHLFVGTDRYHYFTLSWDGKQLKTEKSYVDIAEKAARDSQSGDRVHIDPTNRFMTLECYEGVVNILPITHAGKGKRKAADHEIGELQEPIAVRVPDIRVKSTCFLHKRQPATGTRQPNPEFALLQEDSTNKMKLTIRELEFNPGLNREGETASAELEKGRDVTGNIEIGASHLIPLPVPMYGLLIVGETRISYVDEWDYRIQASEPLDEATVFVAWCAIDNQRYALADDYGKLYLLYIHQNERGEYAGHQLDVLGETSRASTLVYLDGGRIFVGSHQGDSQVIQIKQKDFEVVQTFPNIAPILDFTVMDMGNRSSDAPVNEFSSGQARIVTGSGAFKDGSLRSVRSGVGLDEVGSLGEMVRSPSPNTI
jgi:DNA damage-binding protein 1